MAKTRECCSTLSLRRTGDDLHVSLHKGFKIQLTGIVPVTSEFTDDNTLEIRGRFWVKFQGVEVTLHGNSKGCVSHLALMSSTGSMGIKCNNRCHYGVIITSLFGSVVNQSECCHSFTLVY